MRIIAGFAGGRKLFAPAGERTRPTSDKIRGALFNILGERVRESFVLDLFGGTGALALEAISRGAAGAVISDLDQSAIEAIRRNTETVMHGEDAGRIRIVRGDYRRVISELPPERFDLIFLDPPYRMEEAYQASILLLEGKQLIGSDAVIICERGRGRERILCPGFETYDTREWGDTAVDLIRPRPEGDEG